MKTELITTAVVLRELKCFNINTLRDRIFLQKKIYLLQCLGLNLGYSYSWYLHGPYSPELTTAVYECVPMGEDCFSQYNLKEAALEKINKVNQLAQPLEENGLKLGLSDWYELIASIVYCENRGLTRKDAINEVLKVKTWFTEDQAALAIQTWHALDS